jgi:ketosteroid isomerase-like protein
MSHAQLQSVVRHYVDAYNRFDIDAMLALLHPDVTFQNITNGVINAQTTGKAEFETLARQSATLFKSRRQRITSLEAHGDTVFVVVDFTAVPAADFPNGLGAGDTLADRGKSEFIFKDGLIWSIVDES